MLRPAQSLRRPYGIAIDKEDRLILTDNSSGRVLYVGFCPLLQVAFGLARCGVYLVPFVRNLQGFVGSFAEWQY